MTDRVRLRGTDLRYVVTDHLFRHGPQTIAGILEDFGHYGFDVAGRGSKTLSDALRWEVRRGRLRRL